jgi:hypothetical protein
MHVHSMGMCKTLRFFNGKRLELCPTQPCGTSEDECKWFYCHMIYSPETKHGKKLEYGDTEHYYYLHTGCQLFTVLRTLCTMGPYCHARLFFQSSWFLHESVAPSSAADQLLILLPAWRAGPSPITPRVDPISLRVQAHSRFFVGYRYLMPNFEKNGYGFLGYNICC